MESWKLLLCIWGAFLESENCGFGFTRWGEPRKTETKESAVQQQPKPTQLVPAVPLSCLSLLGSSNQASRRLPIIFLLFECGRTLGRGSGRTDRLDEIVGLLWQQTDWLAAVDQLSWCFCLWKGYQPALCLSWCLLSGDLFFPQLLSVQRWALASCETGTHTVHWMRSSGAFLHGMFFLEQLWVAPSWERVVFPSPLEELSTLLAPLKNCNSSWYFVSLCLVLVTALWGLWPLNRLIVSLCWWSTVTTCPWHLMLNPIWVAQSVAFSHCKLLCLGFTEENLC